MYGRKYTLCFDGLVQVAKVVYTSYMKQRIAGLGCIMEYSSTPYVGMGPEKMATALNAYKMVCSKVCFTCSHKPL